MKEICAEVCSIKPVEEYDDEILPEPVIEEPMVTVSQQQDHNAVVTNEVLTAKEVCRWCQERVETGCTIASFFSESLSWLVDSLCPMLKKDLRTDFMVSFLSFLSNAIFPIIIFKQNILHFITAMRLH